MTPSAPLPAAGQHTEKANATPYIPRELISKLITELILKLLCFKEPVTKEGLPATVHLA
jgi:hypothetical protein